MGPWSQYQRGLETLNESLTGLRCELVLKDGAVAFRPPLEVLRERYFHRMKEFVAYPTTFRPGPRPS